MRIPPVLVTPVNAVEADYTSPAVNIENARNIFASIRENASAGDLLEVVVLRGKKLKTKKLKSKMIEVASKEEYVFEAVKEPTFEQSVLLKSWLRPN